MTVDLSAAPLVAASVVSRNIISRMLNPRKYLPTDDNLPRDYRGLAYLLDFNNDIMSVLVSHADPTMHIFTLLSDKEYVNVTMKTFQEAMEKIDRWDVIDKTQASLETDAIKYMEQQEKAQMSAEKADEQDQDILTLADIHRLQQGLEAQHYDAFLLHADEDIDFVNEMVRKLETEYQLKLCLKHRDLINGSFDHDTIMRIIAERCNRLLIILSPNFFNSAANKFLLSFTQALSIEKRQRILIPCIYKRCELPLQLKYISNVDYNRKGLYDFWGTLSSSIRTASFRVVSSIRRETDLKQETKRTSDECVAQPKLEPLNCPREEPKNCSLTTKDTETVNDSSKQSKKNKTLLKWIKSTASSKAKEVKQDSQLINMPSVDDLDSLGDLQSSSIHSKKKNVFTRFKKKSKPRNVAVKA